MKRPSLSLPVLGLAALLLIIAALLVRNAVMLTGLLMFPQHAIALPEITADFELRIQSVAKQAEFAGLRVGDRLLAVDDQPVRSMAATSQAIFRHRPGETVRFRFQRGAEPPFEISVPLKPLRQTRGPWGEIIFTYYIAIGLPAFSMALGFLVVFQRPRDPVAWALLGFLYGLAYLGVSFGQYRAMFERLFSIPSRFFQVFRVAILPISVLWFGLLFPDRGSPYKLLASLRWPFTIAIAGAIVPYAIANAGMWHAPDVFRGFNQLAESILGNWINYTSNAAMLLGAANLVYRFIREKQVAARRRMKLLVTGVFAGALPIATLIVAGSFVKGADDATVFGEGWLIFALVWLTIVPVTLAYVVLAHKAMDVRVALRQGLRYSLASGGARLAGPLLAALFVTPIAIFMTRRDTGMEGRILGGAAIALVILGVRWLRGRLRAWVDRRYFREAVDAERLLAELGEEVHRETNPHALLDTVARRIADALHVPRVAALLEDGGGFKPALALGYGGQTPAVEFAAGSPAVARLRGSPAAVTLYLDDPENWVHRDAAEDAGRLRELQCELLLPIAARERLMGFLSLGAKQSEEPYSRGDLRLLQSVAAQTGLALENTRLAQAVATEAAQRERLHREIEIAAEVQERLFPKRAPVVAGLELAGRCLPAQTIGGDSFDFLTTPSGEIGLAIADVAGKGIPAALLMAGMQASLRSLTLAGVDDLADLLAKLNRLVYDASPANRFVTFFYGLYEPGSGRLRYASAGHNPALLLRADGTMEWLRARGVGLGLAPRATYEQRETWLHPGDRLVLYTDGVPEARNAVGEEYGEDRMVAAALAGGSAGELMERLIAEAAAFAGEAPRHDDITVIVARRPGVGE